MRRVPYVILAALLGAGGYLAYHKLFTRPVSEPPGPGLEVVNEPAQEPPLPGPILSDAENVPEESPKPKEGRKEEVQVPRGPATPEEKVEKPALAAEERRPSANPDSSTSLDEMVRISQAAFAAGDSARGTKILREIFQSQKDRTDVNIVPQVRKLVELEERGAPETGSAAPSGPGAEARLDPWRYLASRDTDPAWRYRAALVLVTAEARDESSPEKVRSAWDHLTQAYLSASTAAERGKVLEVLRPFVNRHIFSKRFSPLVEVYAVKANDSLNRIAKAKGITEESIRRLNQLKSDVIQPGQRLITLPGKPKVYVKKGEFRLWLMVGERLVMECPVGLGKDNSTPAVVFVIRDRQKDPIWYRRGEAPIPAGDPRNVLGSRWLGFKDTEDGLSGLGIHGTSDPTSIGKEASLGCIRMRNEDIEILWDLVPAGTEVEIRE